MFGITRTLDRATVDKILNIVTKAELHEDVSSYARGRQRTWLNAHWDLKNKTFDREQCFINAELWSILKDVWPDADIGLLTYSGDANPIGIKLHRDDSYADYESYGIQLSGTCEFLYMGGYRDFKWEMNPEPESQRSFQLKPGDVFRFNCKNRHSAIPSQGRYAINLWKVSKKFKAEYDRVMKEPNVKPLF